MARLLVVVFALLVFGAGLLVGSVLLGAPVSVLQPLAEQLDPPTGAVDPADSRAEVFTVAAGATAVQIGEELKQRGLVRSAVGFRRVVEQKGVGGQLAAGDYELSRAMSADQIADVLARGQVKRGIVATIPEGWRAEQIGDRLEALGFTSRAEFLRAVAEPRGVAGSETLGDVPASLEGYLFPWTYEVKERVSGAQAASLMVRQFADRVAGPLRTKAGGGLYSVHQLLTLASIVEREAQKPEERPLIAGVYLNRLTRGMPLQADPTVQYALGTRDGPAAVVYGYWKTDLLPVDLQVDSPYNTYLHSTLPPGPICDPSAAAIEAVITPTPTEFLYFVARGDGSHLFARTLDEHNANVARVMAEESNAQR